ncbi:hypothetical protein [Bordetella genomosp. 5]|uniref:hypothetical protein n=1 Tax=Bordetella genomosp. 5 TaxID=1395608 RepID=UPI0011400D94|nr:hypothetical protein [Bordetella genomosp. 5]
MAKARMGRIGAAWALALACAGIGAGGARAELPVEVVVFNYSPDHEIGEISVQGRYVGGVHWRYGEGDMSSGKSMCCIDVTPGRADVAWEVGWPVSQPIPDEGLGRSAVAVVPADPGQSRYLGVHVYADEHVELTLSPDWPAARPDPAAAPADPDAPSEDAPVR